MWCFPLLYCSAFLTRCCHSHNALLCHGACHCHVAPPLSYRIASALLQCHCQATLPFSCCFATVRWHRLCPTQCICHIAQSLSQYLVFVMLRCHCYVALPLSCRITSVMLCCCSLQPFSQYLVLSSGLLRSCGSACGSAFVIHVLQCSFHLLCFTAPVMVPCLYNAALPRFASIVLLDHCHVARYLFAFCISNAMLPLA